MIQRAIVLANRLVFEGGSKITPTTVGLLRRTLRGLASAGIREVCMVDGEQADALRDALALHELPQLRVEVRANRTWKRASGSTVLVARDFLAASEEPCLVVRGDRPLSGEAVANLASVELGEAIAAVALATAPDFDLTEEFKARVDGDVVTGMHLDYDQYDAVFTGHALVTRDILPSLEALSNPALEDAFALGCGQGKILAVPGMAWSWGYPRPIEVQDTVAALLEAKDHPRHTLLNPGPVNTTAAVKSAMVHHDVCHRDSSFSELMVSLTGKLRRIFRASAEHTAVMITGSGTAAMECAVSSTVPRDGKILVVDNGAFGERLHEIARLHEMDVVHLRYAWGDEVEPADVEAAFEANPDIAVVAMVHHETSVGLLNPVREVGAICRRHDAILIVDAVSSLGAEDLDVVRDNIDVCYGSANKCLHAISGAGFLCVSPRVWQKIEHIKPRSYYLDLKRYRKYVEELAQTPFTPAVSTYFALDKACAEFLADGHAARFAMYRRRNDRMRRGLADLGMFPFTRTGRESHSVVTCGVPDGVTFQELYDRLKGLGYIIYGCKDVLAERFLQIANMGDLDEAAIDAFLATVRRVILEIRAEHGLAQPRAAAARATA